MSALIGAAIGAVLQVAIALLLAGAGWGVARGIERFRDRDRTPFTRWLGLLPTGRPAWHLGVVVLAAAALGVGLTLAGHALIPGYDTIVAGPEAPYGKVARLGSAPVVIAGALLYAFIQTGLSEEILFRGVVARRLVSWLGFGMGNTAQALLFVGIHNAMLLSLTDASPWLHVHVFVMVGTLSWCAGWLMERWFNGSLVGAWMAHAGANLGTCLTVWALIA